jgi:hypothetical protein
MNHSIKKLFYTDIGSGVDSSATNPEQASGGSPKDDSWWHEHSKERFSYEFLVLRDLQKDTLLWQTPALALTAHAFLLTISLNSSSSRLAVIITAFLGAVVSVMSMQLMSKHRFLSLLDRAMLDRLERTMDLEPMTSRRIFFRGDEYVVPDRFSYYLPKRFRFVTRVNSYFVWMVGLAIFGVVNIFIFGLSVLGYEFL